MSSLRLYKRNYHYQFESPCTFYDRLKCFYDEMLEKRRFVGRDDIRILWRCLMTLLLPVNLLAYSQICK